MFSLFSLAPPSSGEISKICLSKYSGEYLPGGFNLHVIFVIFCYQVICFRANLISNVALVLKGRKILLQSFLIRLGENFLGVYLLLVGLFFLDEKDKQETFR